MEYQGAIILGLTAIFAALSLEIVLSVSKKMPCGPILSDGTNNGLRTAE